MTGGESVKVDVGAAVVGVENVVVAAETMDVDVGVERKGATPELESLDLPWRRRPRVHCVRMPRRELSESIVCLWSVSRCQGCHLSSGPSGCQASGSVNEDTIRDERQKRHH